MFYKQVDQRNLKNPSWLGTLGEVKLQ